MLFVGWSIIEGIGAALVIPAVVALAAINYTGRDRAFAYAMLGGVAGAAAAAGPLIGGWVTSEFSWQWVFAAETLLIRRLDLAAGQHNQGPPGPTKHESIRPRGGCSLRRLDGYRRVGPSFCQHLGLA